MGKRIALVAAIVFGVLAAIGVRMYVRQTTERIEGMARRVAIAVAAENLKRGEHLRDARIRRIEVETAAVTPDHILYDQRKRFLDMTLMRQVKAGEPLMRTYFIPPQIDEEVGKRRVDLHMRAVTIGTDALSGVAGLITPGARVDVIATFRMPGRGGQESSVTQVTKLLTRNVPVIAIDHRTSLRVPVYGRSRGAQLDFGYSSVTLHVLPLEANLLVFAQSAGKLYLALRNPDDHRVEERVQDITIQDLEAVIGEVQSRRKLRAQSPPSR